MGNQQAQARGRRTSSTSKSTSASTSTSTSSDTSSDTSEPVMIHQHRQSHIIVHPEIEYLQQMPRFTPLVQEEASLFAVTPISKVPPLSPLPLQQTCEHLGTYVHQQAQLVVTRQIRLGRHIDRTHDITASLIPIIQQRNHELNTLLGELQYLGSLHSSLQSLHAHLQRTMLGIHSLRAFLPPFAQIESFQQFQSQYIIDEEDTESEENNIDKTSTLGEDDIISSNDEPETSSHSRTDRSDSTTSTSSISTATPTPTPGTSTSVLPT